MGAPLPDGIDLRRIFASSSLEGLWGLRPVMADEDWMCCAAALTTVLNHLTVHVNQAQVRDGTQTTKELGTPWKGILKYASSKRMRATATKGTHDWAVRGLVKESKYTLLDWGDWCGHWVLAAGWSSEYDAIVLMDPTKRPFPFVGMRWGDFCSYWNRGESVVPQIAISIYPATRNTKSAKGLEGRTDFRLCTWEIAHVPRNKPRG